MASIERLTYCNYRFLPNDSKRRLFWLERVLFQLMSRLRSNEFFFIMLQIAINPSSPRFNFGMINVYNWFSTVLSILRSGEMVLSLDLQPTRARWVNGFSPCFSTTSFIKMLRVFGPSSLFFPYVINYNLRRLFLSLIISSSISANCLSCKLLSAKHNSFTFLLRNLNVLPSAIDCAGVIATLISEKRSFLNCSLTTSDGFGTASFS